MRIIAGTLGGRALKAPRGTKTRPTSDRVREATFSRIASICGDLTGLHVLDAYAGSGAMGLEALSRGAAHTTFIERDRSAVKTLRENVASLGVRERTTILPGDVARLATTNAVRKVPYGLLILDPPYRIENAEVREVIEALEGHRLLAPVCHAIWEHASDVTPTPGPSWVSLGSKTYGTTRVTIFERDAGNDV